MTDMPKAAMFASIAKLQAELPRIAKGETAQVKSDKGNYTYKYADLADVAAEVMPRLGKFGLGFIARPTLNGDGKFVLAYSLVHESGEREDGEYPLPAAGSPQQIGSAITYARRYTLCAVTGTTPDDDDDGKAAEDGYRHSVGEAPRGHVSRPSRREQAAAAKAAVPDDWQVAVDGIASREDADKVLGELRELWRAKKIAPAVANAVSEQIRGKAAGFPVAEAAA